MKEYKLAKHPKFKAIQFDRSEKVIKKLNIVIREKLDRESSFSIIKGSPYKLILHKLGVNIEVNEGDWIVFSYFDGEFYVFDDDTFKSTFKRDWLLN